MMIEEFEKRTGFYPTLAQYEAIERAYMDFDGDKDAFCKAYKKNADGIAERIQREVNMATFKAQRDQATELTRRDVEIERLKKELEREQEWKPYEDTHNIAQVDYTELAESIPGGAARYMTDAEALDWICSEFGFERSKVTILHEIDEYEINRHSPPRRSRGQKGEYTMAEKHEIFYSKEEALACQAQHKGAEVIAREGHRIWLNGEWTYDIPENRPSWTVIWEEA